MDAARAHLARRITAALPRFSSTVSTDPRIPETRRATARTLFFVTLLTLTYILLLKHPTKSRPIPRMPLSCRDTASHTPRPLIVVSAGAPRSGSTLLYNALRILLRIRDPNLIAGWYVDLQQLFHRYPANIDTYSNATAIDLLRSVGFSILLKIHNVPDWLKFLHGREKALTASDWHIAPHVDAVFTTHRDIRRVIRSQRRMAWGTVHRSAQLSDPMFCVLPNSKEPQWLDAADYDDKQVWVNMARAHILCLDRLRDSAGIKLLDDIKMENFRTSSQLSVITLLQRLAKHLDFPYSAQQLKEAARELHMLNTPKCLSALNVHPVSHLHRAHYAPSIAPDSRERSGIDAIERDDAVQKWLDARGYERSLTL